VNVRVITDPASYTDPHNPFRIWLSPSELKEAARVGAERNIEALGKGWHSTQTGEKFGANIEGSAGEMVVCKKYNIYYHAVVGDIFASDAGPYQVRCNSSRKYHDLCLRSEDRISRNGVKKPNQIYIAVSAETPWFVMKGWVWRDDGMVDRWKSNGEIGRPPCWYVRPEGFHRMEDLPSVEVAERMLKQALHDL